MKWLFRAKSFPGQLSGQVNETVVWEQKARFRGKVGDTVLVLNSEKLFEAVYEIKSLDEETLKVVKGEIHRIALALKLIKKYDEVKELEDYIYSFPRVRNFNEKLYRHFNRKYYHLSELEFDAVDKDEIFVDRTLLGTVLNALQEDHRRAFVRRAAMANPDLLLGQIDYSVVASLLKDYIRSSILVPANQLQAAFESLTAIVENQDAIRAMEFSSDFDGPNRANNIGRQVQAIQQFKGRIADYLVTTIGNGNSGGRKQSVFERKFSGRPLPIQLQTK